MGLDAVEIIMQTEETFGITISDEEAEEARTVRDLYSLVLSKIDTAPACASSIAFYRVRQAMVQTLGVSRRTIRPSTQLEPLLPTENRRKAWKDVEDATKLTLPRLQYPARWKGRFIEAAFISATLVVLSAWGLIAYWYRSFDLSGLAFFVGAFGWIVIFGVTAALLERRAVFLRTELPCSTAGDLALSMLSFKRSSPCPHRRKRKYRERTCG